MTLQYSAVLTDQSHSTSLFALIPAIFTCIETQLETLNAGVLLMTFRGSSGAHLRKSGSHFWFSPNIPNCSKASETKRSNDENRKSLFFPVTFTQSLPICGSRVVTSSFLGGMASARPGSIDRCGPDLILLLLSAAALSINPNFLVNSYAKC